jgi:hypothetical protein
VQRPYFAIRHPGGGAFIVGLNPGPGGGGGDSGDEGDDDVGALTINVTEEPWNVVANGSTDQSDAVQAIIDSLAGLTSNAAGSKKYRIHFPSAPLTYRFNKPVWVDLPNVEITGEGWGTRIEMHPSHRHSIFRFGLRRSEAGNTNVGNASYRPDAFGKLDSGAASSTGQKYGIRTNNNSWVQFQGTPLDAGPSSGTAYYSTWETTGQLTLEFLIDDPGGSGLPSSQPIFNMGNRSGHWRPTPFSIRTSGTGNYEFAFNTSEMPWLSNNLTPRKFIFSSGGAAYPHRVAVVLNLDAEPPWCAAFVNGTQRALTSTSNLTAESTYPFVSGLKLLHNDYHPAMIGARTDRGPVQQANTGIDLALYGLRLSKTARYKNLGVGQPQTRADNDSTTISDTYAYFTNDAHTIGFLPLTDAPAANARTVTVRAGQAGWDTTTSGVWMTCANAGGIYGNAVRNISLSCANGYGRAIELGSVLNFTVQNVRAAYGYNAIGSLNSLASYTTHLIGSNELHGYDAPIALHMHLASQSGFLDLRNTGRVALRLTGCSGSWDNIFVAESTPVTECFAKMLGASSYGGEHVIRHVRCNFENAGQLFSRAAIYCAAHGSTPRGTSLWLENVFFDLIGANAAVIELVDVGTEDGDAYKPALIRAFNVQAIGTTYDCVLRLTGPLWRGEISDSTSLRGPRVKHLGTWGSTANVVIRESVAGLPDSGPWYAGAHILVVRSPGLGDHAEYRCIESGTYGDSDPVWAGVGVLDGLGD